MTSLLPPTSFPAVVHLLAHPLLAEFCSRQVAQAITIFGCSSPLATSLPARQRWHSAQSVDAAIALQKADEAATKTARVARRKALKEKCEEAAHQKLVLQGKGVTWSPASLDLVPALDALGPLFNLETQHDGRSARN